MKTDDLIFLLAADTLPVARRVAAHRLALALLLSIPLAVALLLLGYGLRRDLAQALFLPMFWLRLAFPLAIASAAFITLQRLARPGAKLGVSWIGLFLPVLLLWALGLFSFLNAAVEQRGVLVWGSTWRTCTLNIVLMSLPIFVAAFVALKSLAPTRPVLSGACAGALASSVGTMVYALHCPELAAPFMAIWYVGGMALPVLAGALLGARVLRW